jgi:hypothetical protein
MFRPLTRGDKGDCDELTRLAFYEDFDLEEAFELYLTYCEDGSKESLEKAWLAALPSIRENFKGIYGRDANPKDLVSDVAMAYYNSLRDKKFDPTLGIDYFKVGLFWKAYSSGRSAIKHSRIGRVSTKSYGWGGVKFPRGRLVTKSDIDFKIFLEQLPHMIAENVLPRFRFKDKAHRNACSQILFNFLTNQKSFTGQVAVHFGLPENRVKFLIDYVKVQVRSYLYEVKDEFKSHVLSDWRDVFELVDLEHEILKTT